MGRAGDLFDAISTRSAPSPNHPPAAGRAWLRPGNRPAGRVRTGGEWNGRCVASLRRPRSGTRAVPAYGRAVFVIALRALGDRVLAEDAVQQTFLQAWRAAERFDPSRDPGPWLYAITRRVAVDVYRRERRHRLVTRDEEPEYAALPPSLEKTWEAWEVRCAVDQLPEDERAVVRATHFEGLTHEEAADRLGVPVGTVKSRSHRAHRRLAVIAGARQGGNGMNAVTARTTAPPTWRGTSTVPPCRTGRPAGRMPRCRALVGWAPRLARRRPSLGGAGTGSGGAGGGGRRRRGRSGATVAQMAVAGRRRCGGGRPARCLVAGRQFGAGLAGGAHGCGRHARRHGRVDGWATEDGSHMVVVVAGLGPAASGTVYELWLSADRSSVSAGSFRDDGHFRDDGGRVLS